MIAIYNLSLSGIFVGTHEDTSSAAVREFFISDGEVEMIKLMGVWGRDKLVKVEIMCLFYDLQRGRKYRGGVATF